MIDLVASVIAFVSVRRADEPADVEHPYGHEKLESLAASIEGDADPRRRRPDHLRVVRRLVDGGRVE